MSRAIHTRPTHTRTYSPKLKCACTTSRRTRPCSTLRTTRPFKCRTTTGLAWRKTELLASPAQPSSCEALVAVSSKRWARQSSRRCSVCQGTSTESPRSLKLDLRYRRTPQTAITTCNRSMAMTRTASSKVVTRLDLLS